MSIRRLTQDILERELKIGSRIKHDRVAWHAYGIVYKWACRRVYTDILMAMCVDMCIDVCVNMCIDVSVDMCVDMCMDMYIDMCVDMCIDLCVRARARTCV